MNNQQKEIASAKALGCRVIKDKVYLTEKLQPLFSVDFYGAQYVPVSSLKFTTSRDWSHLLVELVEAEDFYVRLESDGIAIIDFSGEAVYELNHLTKFPSPAQITDACLAVLQEKVE